MLPDTELAYTAGFIDGEGCIMLNRTISAWVSVGNTYLQMLHWLQANWGGSVRDDTQSNSTKNKYHWRIYSNDAVIFLLQIYPYLVEKRPQAAIVIDLFTRARWHTGLTPKSVDKQLQELKRTISRDHVAMPIEVDATQAYLAGWFDAEGCVASHSKVCITNTFLPLLQYIQEHFGGTIGDTTQPNSTKPRYQLSLPSAPALAFLQYMRPYLREKAPQADEFINWHTKPRFGVTVREVDDRLKALKRVNSPPSDL